MATRRSVLMDFPRSHQLSHRNGCIHHPVREAPFIVVPRHHAHERAIHHLGLVQVQDRGSRVVIARVATIFRSTTDTFGTGTLMATPSSRPASSGSTRPTALAAPVEVGIMEIAAARARYRSLWT